MMNEKFHQPAMAKAFKEAKESGNASNLYNLLVEYAATRNVEILQFETEAETEKQLKRAEAWNRERYDTRRDIYEVLETAKEKARYYATNESRPEYLAFDIKGILFDTFTMVRAQQVYFFYDDNLLDDIRETQRYIILKILGGFTLGW